MYHLDRSTVVKGVCYTLLLLGAYLCQSVIFPYLPLWGAKPLVLPVAAAAIAIFEGHLKGGAWGLAAGVLCDSAMNQPAMLFTLLLMVLCVGVGLLTDSVLAKGFPSCVFCVLTVLCVCTSVQILGPVINGGARVITVLGLGIAQLVYSLLFCLPAYLAARAVSRRARI